MLAGVGVKVAVLPEYDTAPATALLPVLNVNVEGVTLDVPKASLKVALIAAFTATLVALLAGLVDTTVGGVISGAVPVVNVHV